MSKDRKGADAFERYYDQLFEGRWSGLREALLADHAYVTVETHLTRPYYLDAASLAVARSLGAAPGDEVLDMCAAPGGKTLVLASGLAGEGRLVANERSATRRGRLHKVLDTHLPEEYRRIIEVTGHDASRWALHEPESYDCVLADVPCSSERHVIGSAGALAQWSPSRTKRLAQAAYAIGCAALDSVRPGGTVVYSTCALSPLENDGVIARLLKRAGGTVQVEKTPPTPVGVHLDWEPTEFGYMVMPDRNTGAGPMYFAKLRK